MKKLTRWILPISILIIWQIVCDRGLVSPTSMASPTRILGTVIDQLQTGSFWNNVFASFSRVFIGFLIALVTALVLGVAIGLSSWFENFTALVLQILKPIPPIAWIPLAILWFGIGEESKIYIIFYGAFFPILINTVDGIKNIDPKYIELAKVYEIDRIRMIRKVILPGALPQIQTGIRVGLGNAWVSVVAAEMIAATKGIGYLLSNGRSLSRPDWVILAMLLIGIVGKLMDDLLTVIFKWVTPGYVREEGRLVKWFKSVRANKTGKVNVESSFSSEDATSEQRSGHTEVTILRTSKATSFLSTAAETNSLSNAETKNLRDRIALKFARKAGASHVKLDTE